MFSVITISVVSGLLVGVAIERWVEEKGIFSKPNKDA